MRMPKPAWTVVAVGMLVVACDANGDRVGDDDSAATIAIPGAESSEPAGAEDDVFTPGDDPTDTPASTRATTSTATTSTTTSTSTTTTTVPTTTTTIAATTTAPPPTTAATNPCPPTGARVWEVRPPSDIAPPPLPDGWRVESAGTSVQGRDLTVLVRPIEAPARVVMVIGGIHGNEPVSPPAVRALVNVDIPDDTEVWLMPLMNPDGSAVGTRCNANGVDLNRNFSWDWRASDGGPGAFSEPEPQAAAALVERVDPDLVVWVHQPLNYVSSIGDTPDSYEQAWSAGSGLPVRPDITQHGGGESWTAFVAGIPSMLIEADSYEARADMVAAQVGGFAALLDVVVPR